MSHVVCTTATIYKLWTHRVFDLSYFADFSRTVSDIFSVKECHDLETRGRGRSRSLKMAPYDRSYTTFSQLRYLRFFALRFLPTLWWFFFAIQFYTFYPHPRITVQ